MYVETHFDKRMECGGEKGENLLDIETHFLKLRNVCRDTFCERRECGGKKGENLLDIETHFLKLGNVFRDAFCERRES